MITIKHHNKRNRQEERFNNQSLVDNIVLGGAFTSLRSGSKSALWTIQSGGAAFDLSTRGSANHLIVGEK
jgi:hypothetical protein